MAESSQIKQEKIGNVTMDMTYYPGEDLYTDGSIEDEMLEIAQNNPPERFSQIIEEKRSWPVFYHFSPFRANIIDWLPIRKTDKVLEIGAGCGAITGALARKAGHVTCIDLSRKRSLVNAYRNKAYENITIMVGNFRDIEPHLDTDYDYVLLIGVFEYGQAYIGGQTPYEDFMRICDCHRKPEGRMIIAIENQFGLKYWAGCREDHLGTYFSGLEGYHEGGSARTFTRRGLEKILAQCGIGDYSFYYPYPDYKFMTAIYSDRYLPQKGELSNNLRNFDRERVLLFDEKQVFDQIIEEGQFPLFSNSYLLVVGRTPDVVYTKFSNDRADKWAIRTSVVQDAAGRVYVEKRPDTRAACQHLKNTKRAHDLLTERYQGTKIDINKCCLIGKDIRRGLAFEFCRGKTLESMLDECYQRSDAAGFKTLVDEYLYWLRYNKDKVAVSNLDFVFSNILVDGDVWHVIDYEWTFDRYIPPKEIAFRAFYTYSLGGAARKECGDLLMKEILGYTEGQIAAAIAEEQEFQRCITGSLASVEHMRELIGNRAYALEGMLSYYNYADHKFIVQVFVDYGGGFCEKNSVKFMDRYSEDKYMKLSFDIPEGAVRVRIDPCAYSCVVDVRMIKVGDRVCTDEVTWMNGSRQEYGAVVFDHEDPNFIVDVSGGERLWVDMEVMELPPMLAHQIVQGAEKEGLLTKVKGMLRTNGKGRPV